MKRSPLLRVVFACSLLVVLTSSPLPAAAGQFTKLVVLGDSLSDTGNLFAATGQTIPPRPYADGRFSNGPVWVEYLAAALDVPFEDYAYGGAETDQRNLFDRSATETSPALDFPGLADEVRLVTTVRALDPDAVYVVWAGANDFRAGLRGDESLDISAIIRNIVNAVGALYLAGARHVVVANLPDLGLTPEGRASGMTDALTFVSELYNANLEIALTTYTPAAVRIDILALLRQTVSDPDESGFTNATSACLTTAGVCATPETYLFWDHVHPTTHGHAVLADNFAKAINQEFVKQHRR